MIDQKNIDTQRYRNCCWNRLQFVSRLYRTLIRQSKVIHLKHLQVVLVEKTQHIYQNKPSSVISDSIWSSDLYFIFCFQNEIFNIRFTKETFLMSLMWYCFGASTIQNFSGEYNKPGFNVAFRDKCTSIWILSSLNHGATTNPKFLSDSTTFQTTKL